MKEHNKLKLALSNGKILYNSDNNENIYPIFKKNLPEVINYWMNSYPEIKVTLFDWKSMTIDGEYDLSKPIKLCNETIFREVMVLNIRLGIYPTSSPEKIKCVEVYTKYEFNMSVWQITVPRTHETELLENALVEGNIVANSSYNSNTFTISKNKLENLIDSWSVSYLELQETLSRWKFVDFDDDDDDDIRTNKKCRSGIIERGKNVSFIFLGIRPKSNGNKLQCFELTAKCEFVVHQLKSGIEEIGLVGRTILAIGSFGMSEYFGYLEHYVYNAITKKDVEFIQRNTIADTLAAMYISRCCPELRINWDG
ncbi:hypothetical protein C2G38_2156086 [Gigaspora rosea]|uniref:Uncharacterized protein n=1 Tax=Gigaspora rosea TaxID=44941 RepID=A0A397W323_9GLOM|nr:hypothetical protein C2G38_2156086 [Gigaspora rosea]